MQTEILKVAGMTCGGCTGKVSQALNQLAGVEGVNVSLSAGEATVQYDERTTSTDQLKAAVKGAGYNVDSTTIARGDQSKGGCCGSQK